MLIRHATLRRNMKSIRTVGLLAGKSKGKLRAVWLHKPARSAWAVLHTANRHRASLWDVAVLVVRVPRAWLRRNRAGLWYCVRDIGPERILGEVGVWELASEATEGRGRVLVAG